MYKIIGALLLACFLTAETRYTLPIKLEKNQDAEKSKDAENTREENKISYRLPTSVKPEAYSIELSVYLDECKTNNFTFNGKVDILLNVMENTKTITLHSQDLNIKDLQVFKTGGVTPSPIDVVYTTETTTNFLNVMQKSQKDFDKGSKYILSITYEAKLNDNLRGFYRSHYINDKGEQVWLATTHFEPVGARRAIPCFDEPAYKATFEMKITHRQNFTAIFNTKSKKTSKSDNGDVRADERVTTEFEKTPLMSTYLLAFVVSDFRTVQNAAKNFTVYARPNAIQFGELAVKKGEELLKKLEAFTNIPFETEIGKMDQIAIPQFTAGAMENWGLVTYREQSLLYNENNSTTAEKQNIVETIAHEFAHQWFGDLVSPKWWKYVWLNEGFANFFQSYITEQVESTWRSVEQSVVNSIQKSAFNFDSSKQTHPINNDVESPVEISNMFDNISYQKGGAVIRMMQHYLTPKIFQKGLQQYLTDNKYKAADSDDLFNSIQKVLDAEKLNIKVKEVMDAWVNKKGYPIVTVTRDYKNNTITLQQERFFAYNASDEEKKNNLWQIPVNYATEKNPDFDDTTAKILFNKATDTVSINGAEKNHWIILNKQQTGFYRVNYDEDNWKLIINYLNSPNGQNIHPLNRAQLINDALAFVKEEILDLETLLQLTVYLKNETDYIAWYPAIDTFSYLNSKLINTEYYSAFKEYVLNATSALVESVGLEATEKDDHIKKLNRVRALSLACSVGHSECTTKMQQKLIDWLKDEKNKPIPKDLKTVTFCYGLRNASHALWEQVLNKTKSHQDISEKKAMIQALSCANQKTILEWYLHYSLANETKDYLQFAFVNVLSNNEVGVDVVLDFLGPNIFKLYWKLDSKKELLQIINTVGLKITTQAQLEKLKALENLNVLIPDDLIDEAIISAEENLKWLQKNNKTLAVRFSLNKSAGGVGTITSSIGLIASLLVVLISNTL